MYKGIRKVLPNIPIPNINTIKFASEKLWSLNILRLIIGCFTVNSVYRNNTKLTTATHIHPNTNRLDHPFVFVLEVTSDRPYRKTGKNTADVIKPGISNFCLIPVLYSCCTIIVYMILNIPIGIFTKKI